MRKKDDPVDLIFDFQSTNGIQVTIPQKLITTLPQGPEYDLFKMQIIVKIIDDLNDDLVFIIPSFVTVNASVASANIDLNSVNKTLYSGDIRETSKAILFLTNILNSQCFESKNNLLNLGNSSFFNSK